MPKHRCASLGGMVLQDLGEISLYVLPKVGLDRTDFYFGRLARARGYVQTPNWSPPEYAVLFSAVWRRKV